MQRIIISVSVLLLTLSSLGGCSYFPGVHKIDIQQGNLVTQDMIDKLKPGMNRNQVRYLMGSPMVTDTFSQDRWDYFHSFRPGGEDTEQKRLTLFFKDDKLTHFSGDYYPGANDKKAVAADEMNSATSPAPAEQQ
ncbi:MAG: outer membrane protein assembly factor BamE [Motiliproteus sp.]